MEAQNLQMHQEAIAAEEAAAAHTENEQRLRQRIKMLEQQLVRVRLLQTQCVNWVTSLHVYSTYEFSGCNM